MECIHTCFQIYLQHMSRLRILQIHPATGYCFCLLKNLLILENNTCKHNHRFLNDMAHIINMYRDIFIYKCLYANITHFL